MIKRCFIDCETTGLDPRQHTIHQLSGMIYQDEELTETFNFNIKPHERGRIDSKALEVSGLTKEIVLGYPDRKEQAPKFLEILRKTVDRYNTKDKMFFVAYNAHFDNGFLRKFLEQNGEKYFGSYFWSNNIDVMTLAGQHLIDKRHEMKNFRQGTVAETLGIEVDQMKLHDSLYDIEIMKQIYDIVK